MIKLKKTLIAATLGLAFAMPQAHASLFSLTYIDSSGGTLSAVLDGTLLGDNNTVIINSVHDFATWNGTPGPSLPFVGSQDAAYPGIPGGLPTLTLDGSFMDFVAETALSNNDGFIFSAGTAFSAVVAGGSPVYTSAPFFGGAFEPFQAANYSLTPVAAAVPVPATLPLLAIGGAALIARRRKAA